ncbi:MAG: hypothetical protein IKO51_06550 [Clostridia bacterium]|nr:hypothetical protein [Clostridia bacterium]
MHVHGWRIEESVDAFACIFEGTCVEKNIDPQLNTADMTFLVENVYRGSVEPGSNVNVVGNDIDFYHEGSRYILFTRRLASVYSGKELYYFTSTPIGESDDDLCICGLEDVNGEPIESVVSRIESHIADHPYAGIDEVFGAYCTSDDYSDIIAFSERAAVVRPTLIYSNEGDRTCYTCTVVSELKGSFGRDSILVVSFKESMKIGSDYIVLLTLGGNKDGSSYLMSSQKSLIEIGSPDAETVLEYFN